MWEEYGFTVGSISGNHGEFKTKDGERIVRFDVRYYETDKFEDFLNIVPDNDELRSYWYDAESVRRVDEPMINGKTYDLY